MAPVKEWFYATKPTSLPETKKCSDNMVQFHAISIIEIIHPGTGYHGKGKEHNHWSWHLFRCICGWPATYGIITKPATPPVTGSLSSTAVSVIILNKKHPSHPGWMAISSPPGWHETSFLVRNPKPKPLLFLGVYIDPSPFPRVFVQETYRLSLLWNGF